MWNLGGMVVRNFHNLLSNRPNLGFSVSGMIIHPLKSDNSKNVIANNNGFAHDDPEASEKLDVIRLDKQFGMSLKTEDVHQVWPLIHFFCFLFVKKH